MIKGNKDFARTRIAKEVILEIEKLLEQGLAYRKINKMTGVSLTTISRIKNGTYVKEAPKWKIEDEEEFKELQVKYENIKKENEMLKDTIGMLESKLIQKNKGSFLSKIGIGK